MGTNYYLHVNPCPHCGRAEEELHIGKSSGGWCFSLHVTPEAGINDLADWKERFPLGVIKDEYGEVHTPAELLEIITERASGRPWDDPRRWQGYANEATFHFRNHSIRGPNGLLRHELGRYCVKHGDGPWDCIEGDFS